MSLSNYRLASLRDKIEAETREAGVKKEVKQEIKKVEKVAAKEKPEKVKNKK